PATRHRAPSGRCRAGGPFVRRAPPGRAARLTSRARADHAPRRVPGLGPGDVRPDPPRGAVVHALVRDDAPGGVRRVAAPGREARARRVRVHRARLRGAVHAGRRPDELVLEVAREVPEHRAAEALLGDPRRLVRDRARRVDAPPLVAVVAPRRTAGLVEVLGPVVAELEVLLVPGLVRAGRDARGGLPRAVGVAGLDAGPAAAERRDAERELCRVDAPR